MLIPLAVFGSVVIGIILLDCQPQDSSTLYRCALQRGTRAKAAAAYLAQQTNNASSRARPRGRAAEHEVRLKYDNTDFINKLADSRRNAVLRAITAITWDKETRPMHKNIDKICVVVLVLTLLVTVAFMNGEKLGIRVVADEDAESYSGSTYFTENDADGDWADNAYTTYITLDGSGGTIDGNGAYFLDGDLVISNGGWYVLTGILEDGKIIVDAHNSSKVWIRLNGVTVRCSDDACLRVDQADKVFLTLAEDTENSFSSGTDYSEEALADNTGSTIFPMNRPSTAAGSLSITAGYKHGIDVNDSLVITGEISRSQRPRTASM